MALWRCPHRAHTMLDCIANISWKPVLWIITMEISIIVIHLKHKQYPMNASFERKHGAFLSGRQLTPFSVLVTARVVFWLVKTNGRVFGTSVVFLTFYLKKRGEGRGWGVDTTWNQVLRYERAIFRSQVEKLSTNYFSLLSHRFDNEITL